MSDCHEKRYEKIRSDVEAVGSSEEFEGRHGSMSDEMRCLISQNGWAIAVMADEIVRLKSRLDED